MTANDAPQLPTRRWFRYSLRTMLVLVTLVCIYLGWAMNWIRQREAFRQANRDLEYSTTRAPWSLRLLGASGVGGLVYQRADEAELLKASRLFPEARIYSIDIFRNGVRYPGRSEINHEGLVEFTYYINGRLFIEKVVPPLG